MTGFGMYKGKKFQDEQRDKLLKLIDAMMRSDEVATIYAGMCADAFHKGMNPFRDQLDLHNQCLLSNVKYQSDKIFVTLKRHIREIERERGWRDIER